MKISINNFESVLDNIQDNLKQIHETNDNQLNFKIKSFINKIKDTKQSGKTLLKDNNILKIGVVGQVKAGKSTFLNALFFNGENILPNASTPMTAGLTILDYAEENTINIEYYNKEEWNEFENKSKEFDNFVNEQILGNPTITREEAETYIYDEDLIVAHELIKSYNKSTKIKIEKKSKIDTIPFKNIHDLQHQLEDIVGVNGTYTPIVKCLTIHLHDERLKGIQIIDTPGVNDPVLSREQKTREFLKSSHGVFFLSYSARFFDSTDTSFLTDRIGAEGIGTVVLIASKFDSVLQDFITDHISYKDDILNTCEQCKKELKEQYYTQIKKTDYNGKTPEWTYSSSIGFSIANKEEKQWNETERHIVNQMKKIFPSFFSTYENIKESFTILSNLDEIRNLYLQDTFIKNKEEIIQTKMNNFFNTQIANHLSSETDTFIKFINEEKSILELSDISSSRHQREEYRNAIDDITNEIENSLNDSLNNLDGIKNNCLNKFSISIYKPIQLPTKNITISWPATNRLRIIFNKPYQIDTQTIDLNKLIEKQSYLINNEIEELEKNWEKNYEKFKEDLIKSISEIIRKKEKEDNTSKIYDILRHQLKSTINQLAKHQTIEFQIYIEKFQNLLNSNLYGSTNIPNRTKVSNKTDAEGNARDAFNIISSRILTIVNTLKDTIYNDIKGKLTNSANEVGKTYNNDKNKFINLFKNNIEHQLDQIDKDIQNKEDKINLYNQILSILNETRKELA